MAEWSDLESRRRLNPTVSSNLTLSAILAGLVQAEEQLGGELLAYCFLALKAFKVM